MNAVGLDVSKGKSMIAVMRPFGEVVAAPYEASHTNAALRELAGFLKGLPGKTRVVILLSACSKDVWALLVPHLPGQSGQWGAYDKYLYKLRHLVENTLLL